MKQTNLKRAVNLIALVLAAGLLMGLVTGCDHKPKGTSKVDSKTEIGISYKVEHWWQNIENDEYTLYDTENLRGKAGEKTQANYHAYSGFTKQDFSQNVIKADGTTVVRIYYKRNEITITLDLDGGSTTTVLANGEGGKKVLKGKYGAPITIADPTKASVTFYKWDPILPATFPPENKKYKAFFYDDAANYIVTIKGDERTNIEESYIAVPQGSQWSTVKAAVTAKIHLPPTWQNDYKVYEFRVDDENGPKIDDTDTIDDHKTIYAVTNYDKFNIDSTGTKIQLWNGKGYSGKKPMGKIIIPDGITEIENGYNYDSDFYSAFKDCTEITSISFPSTLTKIGYSAFRGCAGLTSVDLSGTNLTEISNAAFFDCDYLESIKLPANLNTIGNQAFSRCTRLINIDLSACANLNTIGKRAFNGCTRSTNIDLSACANLNTIGKQAFSGFTGLTSIKLPANLNTIGEQAFNGCTGLTSIDLSGCTNLTTIDDVAFNGCSGLADIDLSGCTSLTTINVAAFVFCTNAEIKLPESITSIGYYSFGFIHDNGTEYYCKKVLIKKGPEFERIKALVTGDPCNYPADRVGEYE